MIHYRIRIWVILSTNSETSHISRHGNTMHKGGGGGGDFLKHPAYVWKCPEMDNFNLNLHSYMLKIFTKSELQLQRFNVSDQSWIPIKIFIFQFIHNIISLIHLLNYYYHDNEL